MILIRLIFLSFLFIILLGNAYLFCQFVPYYGKNKVKYDTFKWKTYKTEHFEIYFYPKEQQHLQMVASIAEEAYQKIRNDLQHDVKFKIPLIFFLTQSEFEQVNYLQVTEGILGVAEPFYNRMAFALDEPPDKLKRLITHELTHIFEFSVLFGGINISLIKSAPPLWIMEGFAEFENEIWFPTDIMVVRDAILTDNLPFISSTRDIVMPPGKEISRAPYTIGHAVWDFIAEKYGKSGVRQLWFQIKKSTYLGEEDLFNYAFGISEEVFNENFAKWLREKFSPYKEKQTPIDYGKLLKIQKPFKQILSAYPSPDGKQLAVLTLNYKDYEIDVTIISTEDGKLIKNLTGGYTTKYEYLTYDSYDFSGRNLTWSSDGKSIAFFARKGKRRSIFILDAKTGRLIKTISVKLDMAGAPSFSPDGRYIAFSALSKGISDIYIVNISNKKIINITSDLYYDKTPIWSSDGKRILYTSRRDGHDQIFEIFLNNFSHRIQYTFGEQDSSSPWYSKDEKFIYFSSDKEGINNIYCLNKEKNEIYQLTDTLGGNFSPFIIRKDDKEILAYTSFFKGGYELVLVEKPKIIATIATEQPKEYLEETEVKMAEAIIPVSKDKILRISPENIRNKGFRAILGSRPNIISGVSGGTFAIASSLTVEDILGDQQFAFFIQRIYGFETYIASYIDLGHRLQFATTFLRLNDFFLAPVNEFFIDVVETKYTGGLFQSYFPLDFWRRFELSASFIKVSQQFYLPIAQSYYEDYLRRTNTPDFLNNGYDLPLSIAFVTETTRFQYWGPLSGYTFKIALEYSPKFSNKFLSRTTLYGDFREYLRLTERSLIAARVRAFNSQGSNPDIFFFGGGNDFRGLEFREIIGNQGVLLNLEYRFPLAPKKLKIPFLNSMRGKIFLDAGQTKFKNQKANFLNPRPNLFLEEGFGSIGAGFTIFLSYLPFNFEFSKVHNFHSFIGGINFDFSIGYEF